MALAIGQLGKLSDARRPGQPPLPLAVMLKFALTAEALIVAANGQLEQALEEIPEVLVHDTPFPHALRTDLPASPPAEDARVGHLSYEVLYQAYAALAPYVNTLDRNLLSIVETLETFGLASLQPGVSGESAAAADQRRRIIARLDESHVDKPSRLSAGAAALRADRAAFDAATGLSLAKLAASETANALRGGKLAAPTAPKGAGLAVTSPPPDRKPARNRTRGDAARQSDKPAARDKSSIPAGDKTERARAPSAPPAPRL